MTTQTPSPSKATQARSAQSLRQEVEGLEQQLAVARREHSGARTQLPVDMASGNAEMIGHTKRQIADSFAQCSNLQESLGFASEALKVAVERERRHGNLKTYEIVKKKTLEVRSALEVLADLSKQYGVQLKAVRRALDQHQVLCAEVGITVDPLILRQRWVGVAELALYLDTDGRFGRNTGLDNPHQLEVSGRASLQRLAADFTAYFLSRTRGALQVSE